VRKVVLDTNIFISSVLWRGNPYKIIQLGLDKKINIFTSVAILKELEKVLKRDFKENEEFIKGQIDLILEYAIVVKTRSKVRIVNDDPDDNKVIECAVDSGADYIVSGDSHLLKIQNYRDIKIISAKDFLEI
jgi:uncharacterized protein